MISPNRSLVTLLGTLAVLSACTGASEYEQDPLFKEAYEHGCWTAGAYIPGDKSTLQRDPALYKSNKAYASGWRMGYNACKTGHPQSNPGIPQEYRGRGTGPSGY
jgi:hypothetical protein